MAQKGITMDITAQITGYQESLKRLQTELSKIDLGSNIGKNLVKAIEEAELRLKSLSKNLTPRATSDTQIDAIVEKANQAGIAVQKVASLMEKIEVKNLNMDAFGEDIKAIHKEIDTLKVNLEEKLSEGIRTAIADSTELKNVFENILHTSIEGKGITELFSALSTGAKQATKDVQEAEAALAAVQNKQIKSQNKLNKDEQGLFGTALSRDQLISQVNEYERSFQDIFSNLRQTLTENLKKQFGNSYGKDQEDLLNNFFKGLTPETIKSKILEFYNGLKNIGLDQGKLDFYNNIFGINAPGGIDQLVKKINLGDPKPIADKLRNFLETIASEIGGKNKAVITDLINSGDIEAATAATLVNINQAYGKVQNRIQKLKDEIAEYMQQSEVLTTNVGDARAVQTVIQSADNELRKRLGELETTNANLLQRIEKLEHEQESKVKQQAQGITDRGHQEKLDVEQWKLGSQEIMQYQQQLDQVHAKEQLVGKLEGVVQRWFSIYAAVNMVSRAINSVIATIKELDKTITEIAIVTDMTQDDLWKQMNDYTEMARSYASSISGVYKVSQLYYQQGLQTAEVMALTEQTLKMARISGLDYATATDYMTNAIRSFKMEMTDAQRVVDVYSAIAAASATDTTELASAMSKTASSAEAVGSSFENTTAMMAVMIEATRESAENIGSAMKSIISRYGEMTKNPSALTDSDGEELSLNRVDAALQSVGISIHDAQGQFRDFDDVIMELAAAWDTIDKNTQRYIATIMAGNRLELLAVA